MDNKKRKREEGRNSEEEEEGDFDKPLTLETFCVRRRREKEEDDEDEEEEEMEDGSSTSQHKGMVVEDEGKLAETVEEIVGMIKRREAFRGHPSLRQLLNLEWGSLNDEDLMFLIQVFETRESWKHLEVLFFSYNSLTAQSALNLSTYLQFNSNLKELFLGSNKIGDQGVLHISEALQVPNCSLVILELFHAEVTDLGAHYLSNALQRNTTLQSLSLSLNEIGDEGAIDLAEGLRYNNTLKRIYLHRNRITMVGGEALYEGLLTSANTTLELVRLRADEWSVVSQSTSGLRRHSEISSAASLKFHNQAFVNSVTRGFLLRLNDLFKPEERETRKWNMVLRPR